MLCRNNEHRLLGPADLRGKECRRCYLARQATYDNRRKVALQLMRDIEDRADQLTRT